MHYLTYQQIDKKKWDTCIDKAGNGLIYGYSFYLDAMAKNWDGLILSAGSHTVNDYEAVMPLTWNKKYGFYYLYQPPFTACLGVFGKSISAEIINGFLNSIPAKFKYWDISFNAGNFFTLAEYTLQERMNYVLPLDDPYENIYGRFRENIKRNIKKSEKFGLIINKNIAIAEVIVLARQQAKDFTSVAVKDPITTGFEHFKKLYQLLYNKECATTYGVYTKQRELMAAAVFFFSHNRAYYIMVGNHPNNKTLGASHALINTFIKDHAGQAGMVLDFEGSDIPSLAYFYSSFGAVEEKYSAIRLNRLPFYLKWMKKT